MNYHERCKAAIEGQPVDRAPRYIPAIACEVTSRILGRQAISGTGSLQFAETVALWNGEAAHREFVQQLFEDLAEVNRALDIDIYRIPWRQTEKPSARIDEHTFVFGDPEGDHNIFLYSPKTADFGMIEQVITSGEEIETKLAREVEILERQAESKAKLDEDNRYVHERFGEEFFVVDNACAIGTGISADDLMLVALAPELLERRCMASAVITVKQAIQAKEKLGSSVFIGGCDIAGENGPMISPAAFRRIVNPAIEYVAREFDKIGAHYVFRSDGNLWALTDMLFEEAGCQGYGEVDRGASMSVGVLRQRYPDLVIWGNMPSAQVHHESAQWVQDETARCLEESKGTRYFHGASNAIMKGTPIENVYAMFE
jgi:hypothetical protein